LSLASIPTDNLTSENKTVRHVVFPQKLRFKSQQFKVILIVPTFFNAEILLFEVLIIVKLKEKVQLSNLSHF